MKERPDSKKTMIEAKIEVQTFKLLKCILTIFTCSLHKSTTSAVATGVGFVVSFVFAAFSLALLFS